MGNHDYDELYIDFAIAILDAAKTDYEEALKKYRINPKDKAALEVIKEVEEFFRSSLFQMILDVAPDRVIKTLKG